MNTGTFAGYLGRDADLRTTQSGHDVLNFSVGVTVGFGDNKKTLWVGCSLWGDRAEKLHPYLKKGQPVSVSGDVDLRTYETQAGKSGAELTLNVQRVTMLGGKKDGEGQRPASNQRKESVSAGGNPGPSQEDFDDEIPFIWAVALPIAGLLFALLSSSPMIA